MFQVFTIMNISNYLNTTAEISESFLTRIGIFFSSMSIEPNSSSKSCSLPPLRP